MWEIFSRACVKEAMAPDGGRTLENTLLSVYKCVRGQSPNINRMQWMTLNFTEAECHKARNLLLEKRKPAKEVPKKRATQENALKDIFEWEEEMDFEGSDL